MQIWAQMMRATCYYERSLKRKKKKRKIFLKDQL